MKSKYELSPVDIEKMGENELKEYLRSGYKVLQSKFKRISRTEFADFSEFIHEYETIKNRYNSIGSSSKLSISQLKRKVKEVSRLFTIKETAKQLQDEGTRNIKDFFKEPRYTRAFIEAIGKNQKILADLVNKNDSFIHEIMPSDEINEIFNNDKTEEEQYRDILLKTSEHLDLRDNAEKEQLINNQFNPVFEQVSKTKWKEIETGKIINKGEKW